MPNIKTQIVNANGITIATSNGKTFNITSAAILAYYAGTTGTVAARRALTIAWIQQQIETACGVDQVPQTKVTVDFDETTGIPQSLKTTS